VTPVSFFSLQKLLARDTNVSVENRINGTERRTGHSWIQQLTVPLLSMIQLHLFQTLLLHKESTQRLADLDLEILKLEAEVNKLHVMLSLDRTEEMEKIKQDNAELEKKLDVYKMAEANKAFARFAKR
jgi:hypothetical protein